jgi:hypothetical protein
MGKALSLINEFHYWNYSEWLQKLIKDAIKAKDQWSLTCFYDEHCGYWKFHLAQFFIWNEGLLNGTEKAINWWYEQKADHSLQHGAKIKITASSKKMADADTFISYLADDTFDLSASEYLEAKSDTTIWLCGMNQMLFGEKAEYIWLKFEIIK